ncbi:MULTISPECIES: hypothetical protein [unclassified Mesorhizobium]|uniref:hypothetical protein n=1 Tax=unclassified Mesorhizobium TaxID=325217 RepID=UPI0012E359C2|nr:MULTISPECIES: hypothetical protein [unclassified Mesorhizobium]
MGIPRADRDLAARRWMPVGRAMKAEMTAQFVTDALIMAIWRMLTKVEAKFGTLPIPALDDPRVRQDFMSWRAEVARSSGDREADNRLSDISAMLSWARDSGRMTASHVAGFRRFHKSDRSEKIWLPQDIERPGGAAAGTDPGAAHRPKAG